MYNQVRNLIKDFAAIILLTMATCKIGREIPQRRDYADAQ